MSKTDNSQQAGSAPPAVPLPADEDLPDEIRKTLAQLPPLNVFRMLANAPESFRPFLELGGSLLSHQPFDARSREIAILRVATVTDAPYEWTQHRQLARNLGVTEQELNTIATENPVAGLDQDGNLLCRNRCV